jgi:hypothetical protein
MEENKWTESDILTWIGYPTAVHSSATTDADPQVQSNFFIAGYLRHSNNTKIDNEKDANCPNCTGQEPKTEDHILRCPHELLKLAGKTGINSFIWTRLSKLETPTDLIKCILHGLHSWIVLSTSQSKDSIKTK